MSLEICSEIIDHSTGELEETISRSFTRSSNLRAFLTRIECPEAIRLAHSMFDKLIGARLRGSLQTDIRSFTALLEEEDNEAIVKGSPIDLPSELVDIFEDLVSDFSQCRVHRCADISLRGLTYSTSTRHSGNSCVIVPGMLGVDGVPARIQDIFQVVNAQNQVSTYVSIRRHKKTTLHHNVYAQFPSLNVSLWEAELGPIAIMSLNAIISHFACLPIKPKFGRAQVAILPLYRSG